MLDKSPPLVSIITPTYNSSKHIEQNLKSVNEQSFKDYEHIIVDDCSHDNTFEIVEKAAKQNPKIRYFRLEENGGAGVARNKAIEMASGRFIAFLDSDDLWHKDKLSVQIDFMFKNNLAMSYCSYYVMNEFGELQYIRAAPKKVGYSDILKNDYMGFLTTVYDTKYLGKMYMPEIRKRQDWALKIRILQKNQPALGILQPLAYYRVGHNSISKNKNKLLKYNFNVFRKELKMSYIESIFRMANFLLHYGVYKVTSKKPIGAFQE
ncbi:glycosyltransferase family 2 protein [Ascidiimonas sp. W6]|uniref:glycosyltransferase family 2 protein n=1 Tax=Ascidiimonas meishanensis TaxID=3128903 RepID=UPI0030EC8400